MHARATCLICRHSTEGKGGKKARHNIAQLVEGDIPGLAPVIIQKAPRARDPAAHELIGKRVS